MAAFGTVVVTDQLRSERKVALMLYNGDSYASFYLPLSEARQFAEALLREVEDFDLGPREGTPADLGCEVL